MSEPQVSAPATAPATPPPAPAKEDGQVDVPSEGTTTAPPEAKPDPFHKAYSHLAKQEKALLEKQKAFSASAKRNEQIEAAYALADKDPLASIEALGKIFGRDNLFEQAATAAVSRKKVDPVAQQALSEIDVLRQDLVIERAIPLLTQGADLEAIAEHLGVEPEKLAKVLGDKRYASRVEKAQSAYSQSIENTLSQHAQQTAEWVTSVKEADGTDKYELIVALEAQDKVFQLIERHFEETLALGKPVQLTREEAADIIEQELLNQARKMSGARKLKPVEEPKPAKREDKPAPKRTLSNTAAQESSTPQKPLTERERLAEATRLMEKLRSK